jgi:hypothetical protein
MAESQRFAAMTRQDFVALDSLLGDELQYTHTSGQTETKAQFLETLRSQRIVYLSISPSDVRVLSLSDTATVITGRSRMRLRASPANLEFDIRFIDVLVRRGHHWVSVRWQSTRISS